MSEPFKVPEAHKWWATINGRTDEVVWASDLPALVKQEVERALLAENGGTYLSDEAEAYLATRFPEAAPEAKQEGHYLGCCLDTDHKGPCLKRCVPDTTKPEPPTPSAPATIEEASERLHEQARKIREQTRKIREAGARPEAGNIAAMTAPELIAHLERILARDAAEREFVRRLAAHVVAGATRGPQHTYSAELLGAAHNVVSDA